MATIEKRGNNYRITVSAGYSSDGKQIKKRLTWRPPEGLTQRQIEKELNKQAVMFERKVETGQFLDGTITFAEFTDRWFKEYAESHLKEQSIVCYKDIIGRVIDAIGHIKLAKLQPHHLQEFYNELSKEGMRLDTKYKAVNDFKHIMKEKGYTQKSLAVAAGVSLQCVRSCTGGKNITRVTAEKVAAVMGDKDIFEPVGNDKRLSDSTVIKYHRLISSILSTAVQWQIIPSNPCSRLKPPHVEHREAVVLEDYEVEQLIECLKGEPLKYRVAVMLILYTGMRRGELCGLEWRDVDLDNGLISISRNLLYTPSRGLYEDSTKTKSSNRVLNIPDDMVRLLNRYRYEQNILRLKCGDQWANSEKLITSESGEPMRPDTLSSWFKKFVHKNGLPDIHIHTLRHISATLLIAGGVDVATVSKRLGHSNKSTTLNIYTHAIQTADAKAAEQLELMLSQKKISGGYA